jgi:rare lipoprotein A
VKLRISQVLCIVLLSGTFLVLSDGHALTKTGLASYYGAELAGQPTASGEPFDPYGFTAAHRTLPLGTKLIVSYGGRSVEVTVNDRGPYTGGRDLDLSQGAADYLGLSAAGVDYVNYVVEGSAEGSAQAPTYSQTNYTQPQNAGYSAPDQGAANGTYVVQTGDTLSSIAAELGTTVDYLAAYNGLEDPNILYTGQRLNY